MMQVEKRYQFFVSSTFEDLQKERKEVIQALLELDFIPAVMELFPATNEEQWQLIKRILDASDYFILILGGRYGSTDQTGISYTEKEYDYAVSTGKPILAFIHHDPSSLPSGNVEKSPKGRQKLLDFQKKVKKNKLYRTWKSPEDLAGLVSRAAVRLISTNPGEGWIRGRFAANPNDLVELVELRRERESQIKKPVMPPTDREFSDFENAAKILVDYFEIRQSIDVVCQDTSWVFRLLPSLAWARLKGHRVRVVCGEPLDSYSRQRLGLLFRLGCQVRFLGRLDRPPLELFLFDSELENFGRALVIGTSEPQQTHGYATAYSRGIDRRIIPLLQKEFEELWEHGVEMCSASATKVTLEKIDVAEVIRRLKLGVAQYFSPEVEIGFEYIDLSKIKFLASRLYQYKYRQIPKVLRLYKEVNAKFFEPVALRFAEDKFSILTPPIIEIWNSTAIVLNGSHRCIFALREQLVDKVGCIVVRNVSEALPGEPVDPSRVSLESQRQPPGTRIIGFNYSRFRHVESAVHPPQEIWLPNDGQKTE
jgi:hypothetical protein